MLEVITLTTVFKSEYEEGTKEYYEELLAHYKRLKKDDDQMIKTLSEVLELEIYEATVCH